jgi:uncharacterized protein DUF2834
MTVSRKALCATYAIIGVLAAVGTWGNVLGLVTQAGFVEGTVRFWQDTLVNASSRFITADTLFLGLAVVVWMVLEARRLSMPGVWLYVVFGLLVAISIAVPLFMIHRERRLAAQGPGTPAGTLRAADAAGLFALGAVSTAYAVVALSR